MARRATQMAKVTVADFLEVGQQKLELDLVAGKKGLKRRINEAALNRPGLALTGFFEYFAQRRIQVFGKAETAYLDSLSAQERADSLKRFLKERIPCLVVARNLRVFPEVKKFAEAREIPVMRTRMVTRYFINAATLVMENISRQHMRYQGTMVEVAGMGVLIEGRPGMGKSETALSLIRKGHSLVADDVALLRVDSSGAVVGASVDVTRYHMDIRGLGIIHVPSLFGVAAVREEKRLDLIVSLCAPNTEDASDRSLEVQQTLQVLGVDIPHITIPVAPGCDLSDLVEAAAMDQKLRKLGHNAAKELDEDLITALTGESAASE